MPGGWGMLRTRGWEWRMIQVERTKHRPGEHEGRIKDVQLHLK